MIRFFVDCLLDNFSKFGKISSGCHRSKITKQYFLLVFCRQSAVCGQYILIRRLEGPEIWDIECRLRARPGWAAPPSGGCSLLHLLLTFISPQRLDSDSVMTGHWTGHNGLIWSEWRSKSEFHHNNKQPKLSAAATGFRLCCYHVRSCQILTAEWNDRAGQQHGSLLVTCPVFCNL